MSPKDNAWEDEALLKTVVHQWMLGASFTEIANEAKLLFDVSLTRNAIAGKIHRLGLVRNKEPKPPRSPKKQLSSSLSPSPPSPPHRSYRPRRLALVPPTAPLGPMRELRFAELEPGDCQFPIGNFPDVRFCGRPLWKGFYCFECWRRTHLSQAQSA